MKQDKKKKRKKRNIEIVQNNFNSLNDTISSLKRFHVIK